MKPLLVLVAFLTVTTCFGQIDTTKNQHVRRLLIASGTGVNAKLGVESMINMMQNSPAYSTIPAEFWTKFQQGIDYNELVELYVPVYAKHFTDAEIKELTAFYESPLGKKMTDTTPAITTEMMEIGRVWGGKIGQKVADEMKKDQEVKQDDEAAQEDEVIAEEEAPKAQLKSSKKASKLPKKQPQKKSPR